MGSLSLVFGLFELCFGGPRESLSDFLRVSRGALGMSRGRGDHLWRSGGLASSLDLCCRIVHLASQLVRGDVVGGKFSATTGGEDVNEERGAHSEPKIKRDRAEKEKMDPGSARKPLQSFAADLPCIDVSKFDKTNPSSVLGGAPGGGLGHPWGGGSPRVLSEDPLGNLMPLLGYFLGGALWRLWGDEVHFKRELFENKQHCNSIGSIT